MTESSVDEMITVGAVSVVVLPAVADCPTSAITLFFIPAIETEPAPENLPVDTPAPKATPKIAVSDSAITLILLLTAVSVTLTTESLIFAVKLFSIWL